MKKKKCDTHLIATLDINQVLFLPRLSYKARERIWLDYHIVFKYWCLLMRENLPSRIGRRTSRWPRSSTLMILSRTFLCSHFEPALFVLTAAARRSSALSSDCIICSKWTLLITPAWLTLLEISSRRLIGRLSHVYGNEHRRYSLLPCSRENLTIFAWDCRNRAQRHDSSFATLAPRVYFNVLGTHARRREMWTLAQLRSFAHRLRSYLVYLCRGMKLIVIAYYPNNSHFYFSSIECERASALSRLSRSFALHLFILAYINNRRAFDWRHVVSPLLWIIVQKRSTYPYTSRWNNNNWYLSFCLFWLFSVGTNEKAIHQKHTWTREREKQQSNIYD